MYNKGQRPLYAVNNNDLLTSQRHHRRRHRHLNDAIFGEQTSSGGSSRLPRQTESTQSSPRSLSVTLWGFLDPHIQ